MRLSRTVQVGIAALLMAGCGNSATVPSPPTATAVTVATQPSIPSTTSRAGASFDVIDAVNDAAVTACADGVLTPNDLDVYRDTLQDFRVDPGSALSRTALIVECGLTDESALDLLR